MDPEQKKSPVTIQDLMEDPDTINLEDFSLTDPPETDVKEEPAAPSFQETPEFKNLMETVQSLQKNFDSLKEAPEKKEEPVKDEPHLPEPPTDAELQALVDEGNILGAMQGMMKKFAHENFVPAIQKLTDNVTTQQEEDRSTQTQTLTALAANAIEKAVAADPSIYALRDEIYPMFKGADPRAILVPGVIERVINQKVGELAREGKWSGRPPSGSPTPEGHGDAGTQEVNPAMRDVFRALTGIQNPSDEVLDVLSKPHLIDVGRGES